MATIFWISATLVLFGAIQMGLPYFLVARGMRSVSPQEAGTITLIEPLLNPLWAYLISDEVPSPWTLATRLARDSTSSRA